MKKTCILWIIMSFMLAWFVASAEAASVVLQWSPSDTATGYKIYYGTASGVYNETVRDVGNVLTHEIGPLGVGTYYFAATAYNQYGESELSDEVSATIVNPLPDSAVITLEKRDRELWVKWPAYHGIFPTNGFKVFLDDVLKTTVEPTVTEYNFGVVSNGFHTVVVKTWNQYGEVVSNEEVITIENTPVPPGTFSGKVSYTFENGLLISVDIE